MLVSGLSVDQIDQMSISKERPVDHLTLHPLPFTLHALRLRALRARRSLGEVWDASRLMMVPLSDPGQKTPGPGVQQSVA